MSKDLVRLMHVLFPTAAPSTGAGLWRPAADVYQTRRGWLVKLDLAGVRPEDVRVEVQGRQLRIRGSRRDCAIEEGCQYYQMEIAYSSFERILEMPCDLEPTNVSTDYRDGMLLVLIRTEAPGDPQQR
jgi:HSP20 family protein